MTAPVTKRLATFIAETDYPRLSRNAIENAKLHILDTLGVALAAYGSPIATIALNYCRYTSAPADWRLNRKSFSDAKVAEPKVQEALSKVKVIVDETIPEHGEYCPVSIELKDGRKVQYTATIQKGHTNNPLSENEVLDKFLDNAGEIISRERGEEIIHCVRSLETVREIKELTQLLAA